MYNRILRALLYLLPGNIYQSPDNPLQADRLPDTSRVELDYPVYQESPAAAARRFVTIAFCASVIVPVLIWASALLPIAFLFGGLYTIALMLAGALMALGIFGRWWPLASYGIAAAMLPVLAILVRDVPFSLAALLLVFVGQTIFSESVASSYLHFKTAAPVPHQRAVTIRNLWRQRFRNFRSPFRGCELHWSGYFVMLPVAWLIVAAVNVVPNAWPFFQIALLFSAILVIGLLWSQVSEWLVAPLFGRSPYPIRTRLRALLQAIVLWGTYNRRHARGAGVHQSPGGDCAFRQFFVVGLIGAWCCIWAGLQRQAPQKPMMNFFDGLKRIQQGVYDLAPPSSGVGTGGIVWDDGGPRDPLTGRSANDEQIELQLKQQRMHGPPPHRLQISDGTLWDDGGPQDPLTGRTLSEEQSALPSKQQGTYPAPPPSNRTSLTGESQGEPGLPPVLEPYEQKFLSRLTPDQKAKYLWQRAVGHAKEEVQATEGSDHAAATQTPKNLLVRFFHHLGVALVHVLVPSLGALATCAVLLLTTAGRSLAGIEECLGADPHKRVFTTDNWENLVARVRHSEDKIEKTSILLGVNARDDTPVLVPRKVFNEHAHILGDSGSGKTSLGLAPLVTQLIRFGDCSVVVLDLKADDQFLLETLRKETDALSKTSGPPGYPFRWFTTVLGRSSFAFNPLTQRVMSKLHPDQRTDVLTAALGLQYGTDYGRKFFGDANYDVLNYALREHPNLQSFAELEQVLLNAQSFPLPPKTKEAASHVQSSVRRLARCPALNVCPNQLSPQALLENAIDLGQLFSRPQALYVALSPTAGISSTAEVARIFLYSLLASAQMHEGLRKPVVLLIDEFQRIVSKNLELFLQQARSMNIGCILSNQSLAYLAQFEKNFTDFSHRVRTVLGLCCSGKRFRACSEDLPP